MENIIMGYISRKLQEQTVPEQDQRPWVICPYCQTQVRKTRDDDFCCLMCKRRWDAEKAAIDRLNQEPKTIDEVIEGMDKELKRRRS
jgi:endogenous inhibitor of DNA gyrase (YacG/DUF329 family)